MSGHPCPGCLSRRLTMMSSVLSTAQVLVDSAVSGGCAGFVEQEPGGCFEDGGDIGIGAVVEEDLPQSQVGRVLFQPRQDAGGEGNPHRGRGPGGLPERGQRRVGEAFVDGPDGADVGGVLLDAPKPWERASVPCGEGTRMSRPRSPSAAVDL